MPDKPPERIWIRRPQPQRPIGKLYKGHDVAIQQVNKDDVEYILASQVSAEKETLEDEHDKELGRWQEAIRDLVIKVSGAPDSEIDGGGDSGDPLDLSLAEITQGLNFVIDQLDELRANHATAVAAEKEKVWDRAIGIVNNGAENDMPAEITERLKAARIGDK